MDSVRSYNGSTKNGRMYGKAEYTFPTGTKYVGDIKDGLFHGKGVLFFPNGSKYEATWEKGIAKQDWDAGAAFSGRLTDFPLPRQLLQLHQGKPETFLGQLRDIVPSVCPEPCPGPPPGGTCWEHLSKEEVSKEHLKQMLSPFNVKERWLYTEPQTLYIQSV